MLFGCLESLKLEGFMGFKTVADLRKDMSEVPMERGVNMALHLGKERPSFVAKGSGGHFKGEDPNVPESLLERKWVDGPIVIYIGQAGGKKGDGDFSDSTLTSIKVNGDMSLLPAMSAQLRHKTVGQTQQSYYRIEQGAAGRQLKNAWKNGPAIVARRPVIDSKYEPSGYD